MAIICILLIIAVGTFAIFKLVMWSLDTGNKIGNVISLVIALAMLVTTTKIIKADENPKPAPRIEQVQTTTAIEAPVETPAATPAPESPIVEQSASKVESRQLSPAELNAKHEAELEQSRQQAAESKRHLKETLSDEQIKNRIKNDLERLPGASIVIVRGTRDALIVDCDYDFGLSDKTAAQNAAMNLIYEIMNANSDCNFKFVSVVCMNGKSPAGVMVTWEDGIFTTHP